MPASIDASPLGKLDAFKLALTDADETCSNSANTSDRVRQDHDPGGESARDKQDFPGAVSPLNRVVEVLGREDVLDLRLSQLGNGMDVGTLSLRVVDRLVAPRSFGPWTEMGLEVLPCFVVEFCCALHVVVLVRRLVDGLQGATSRQRCKGEDAVPRPSRPLPKLS